jgi:hypothetical protein
VVAVGKAAAITTQAPSAVVDQLDFMGCAHVAYGRFRND